MLIKCDLCGGENKLLPGQKMLKCSYCGSALAVEDSHFEHLILPHERNDRVAGDMLRSFLLRRGAGPPVETKIDFSYVPFSVIEDDTGGTSCIPAEGAPHAAGPLADIPAGDYSFFDRDLASGEKIIEEGSRDSRASRLIHLPLYIAAFRIRKKRCRAVITGENWHVQMEKMPARKKSPLDISLLLPVAGLFVLYLMIGGLGASWPARLGFIAAAASAAWFTYRIREKVTAGNER
ncbi:MAG: hypothetical protein GF417_07855 [Candidatus Latescibacteria bacterium]|nr:hypothetical protein [bacterium]MBD3424334.1 hypothetical protein [Candidatus Latescibacterota bacterium]